MQLQDADGSPDETTLSSSFNLLEKSTVDAVSQFYVLEASPISSHGCELALTNDSAAQEEQRHEKPVEPQHLFRTIFNHTSQLTGVLQTDGRVLVCNQAMLNFDRQAVPTRDWADILFWQTPLWRPSSPEQKQVKAAIAQAAAGEVVPYEAELIGANGQLHTFDFSIKPLKDEAGNVSLLLLEGYDITERKQAEAALKREQEFIHTLVENISKGVVACDAEGNLTLFNQTARRGHGTDLRAVPPEAWSSFYNLYCADGITALPTEEIPLVRAFRGEEVREAGMAIAAKNQPLRFITANGIPLFNAEGQKIGAVVVMHDITERKQAEEALQKQTSILQLILDRMSDGVIVADAQGKFLVFNPAAERIFGSGATDSGAQKWSQQYGLFLPNQVTPFPEKQLPLVRAIQGESVNNVEMFVRHAQAPDGMWVLVNGRSLRDSNGDLIGGVIVCRDITERKRAEESSRQSEAALRQKAEELEQTLHELQQTQTKLIQSEKMSSLGQLVAGVAHEINNPVNFIYGNLVHAQEYTDDLLGLVHLYQQQYPQAIPEITAAVDAIELEFLAEDLPKLLSSMKVGAERIREIVRSLRNFSRLDEAEMKQVDLHAGIDSTLMILQNRLKAKPEHPGIKIIKEYGSLPKVECYVGQLNQVFMNILVNAIDALDERDKNRDLEECQNNPSVIRITTAMGDNHQVKIEIADNGPGIPSKLQNRLFDPFFTTKPVGKGTGLGLSISYQIVTEKHGGQLECRSNLGVGTAFLITIPIQPANL